MNNGVKWTFIAPKKFEQINDYLFIDIYKSNQIKVGMNDMTVNYRKCVSIPGYISLIVYSLGEYRQGGKVE